MASTDFVQRYCTRAGIEPSAFRAAVLRETLYPAARWLRPLLRLIDSDFFAADHDFVDGVGLLTQRRNFGVEAEQFTHHPANRGLLRRAFRLRVSVQRMQDLVNEVFGATTTAPFSVGPGNSPPPFAADNSTTKTPPGSKVSSS